MKKHLHEYWVVACLLLMAANFPAGLLADNKEQSETTRFEAADSQGVVATRDEDSVYLQIEPDVKSPITIPRLAAPLRSMAWEGHGAGHGIQLRPEPETWQISWKDRPEGAKRIVLKFDAPALLMDEVKPIEATGDGSFYLPAHLAITDGEKVRYEPQTYKNTVGYWTGKEDSAGWKIDLKKPGRFSVAVLQGCGKGQGGSDATMMFASGTEAVDTIDFKVVETGHFQKFQWVHLGEVELSITGNVAIAVMPKHIKKAALMDIRAIHLIRLPD